MDQTKPKILPAATEGEGLHPDPNPQHSPEPNGQPMPTDGPGTPQEDTPRHPGVLILRVPSQQTQGSEDLQIIPINGMDPLAVPTVLKLAIKLHNQTYGLE